MIEIKNLSKNFEIGSTSLPIIENLNLQIQDGDFISIIGPSGSGKSTILHLIAGFIKPSSGHLLIDNLDLSSVDDQQISELRNQKIGFVFQDFNLLNHLNLEENIALPYLIKAKSHSLHKIKTPENKHVEIKKLVAALLIKVGLEHRAGHKPTQISGGQKQRTAIARALMNQPEILLADEPTGNLDAKTGKQIIELIKKIHSEQKITVIVATHDKEIAAYADHVIEIQDGKILPKTHLHKFTG